MHEKRVSLSSTKFIPNIFAALNIRRFTLEKGPETQVGLHVEHPLLLLDFNLKLNVQYHKFY